MDNLPLAAPGAASAASRWAIATPLLVAVVVMLTFIAIPIAPTDLDTDADTSFSMVVNYELERGSHLGMDLVHTYGPLGHLIFIYYAPEIANQRVVSDALFTYAVAAGLCLVAWRIGWPWRLALLALVIYLAPNVHPRIDLLFDIGTFSWGLLCCVESGRKLKISAAVFVALAIFGALGKNSMLFMDGLSLVWLAAFLTARGHWRVSLAMMAGFALGVATGWLLIAHSLHSLFEAAVNALSIVQGYNQAMGWDTLPLSIQGGLLVLALAIPLVIIRALTAIPREEKNCALRRLLLLAWLTALLFLDWKHGFVRGDIWHVAYFFAFVPVMVLALEVFPSSSRAALRWSRVLAVASCCFCAGVLQLQYFPSPAKSLATPFSAFLQHTHDLLAPGAYRQRMNDAIALDRREADLPKLRNILKDAPVDVFGQNQIYALLNGFNYRPRPVFQSYVVYNRHLMRLNEQFQLSTNAPGFMMFRLAPTDRRFPALEDAMLFRDVLFNFELAAVENPFLLLRATSRTQTQLTLLRDGNTHPGELIDITNYGNTDLWMTLDIKPTLVGRLRQLLYRPSTVRLGAWRDSKHLLLRRRAPPIMLAAGFVASPFLASNEDMENFYDGSRIVRPTAYSVEMLPGEEQFWQPDIRFRVYRIAKP